MNIASAQMLQDSLRNLAESLYRSRALEEATQERMQRNAIDQAFRQAQFEHYRNLEQKEDDRASAQAARDDRAQAGTESAYVTDENGTHFIQGPTGIIQRAQDALAAQGRDVKFCSTPPKDLPPTAVSFDNGTVKVVSYVNDPSEAADAAANLQKQFGAKPAAGAGGKGFGGAAAGNEQLARQYATQAQDLRDQADAEDDPDRKAALETQAQGLEDAAKRLQSINAKMGQGAPPPAGMVTPPSAAAGAAAGAGGAGAPAVGAGAADAAAPFTPPAGTLGAYLQGINPTSLAPGAGDSTNLPPTGPSLGSTALNLNGIPTGQPALPAAPPVPQGMVRVRHPNGQTGFLPTNSLPAALQQNYQLIGQ